MSRFFADTVSSSEEESGEEELLFARQDDRHRRKFLAGSETESEVSVEEGLEAEEEVKEESAADQRNKEMAVRRSRFLIGESESGSGEEDQQRVVKSQKDKTWEEISTIAEVMGDAIDEDEWTVVAVDFDRLMKTAGRAAKFGPLPETFFDFVEFFADVLTEKAGESVKKLRADEARAFNALKQKFKKIDFSEFGRSIVADQPAEESVKEKSEVKTDAETAPIIPATIPQIIQDILGARGKRRATERLEGISLLKRCLTVANTSELKTQALVALLSVTMEGAGTMAADHLLSLIDNLAQLATLLQSIPVRAAIPDDDRSLMIVSFAVSFGSLVQRCDDELTVALNVCDHHSPAYLELVRVESRLIELLMTACNLLSEYQSLDESSLDCVSRLLDRTFYRHQTGSVDVKALLIRLYQSGQEHHQTHAVLCHVHIMACRNRFEEARQVLLDTHISDHVHRHPVSLQILHNRVLVQLGLAAFRAGQVIEAYFCLQEICSSGRPKELLGQSSVHHLQHHGGQQHHYRHHERTELIRLIPHHLHINIELIDTVFTVASMLLELPQAAAQHSAVHQPIPKKVFQSRHLRRILDGYERSLFNGPPENSRETVVAAVRAMSRGDWRGCMELLLDGIKVWSGTGLGMPAKELREMLAGKIKRAALLLYLYTLAPSLPSISHSHLTRLFDLDESAVREVLHSHIANGSIQATPNSNDLFMWKDDRQLRSDLLERTSAHLRELALPLCSDDPLACEFIVYGHTTSDHSELFSSSPLPSPSAAIA